MTVRWNGGIGAITCDACGVIYKYGFPDKGFPAVHLCGGSRCIGGGDPNKSYEKLYEIAEGTDDRQEDHR